MLRRLGVENRTELVIFVSVILLVAISPLESEGTHPALFVISRSLLLAIAIACALSNKAKEYSINPYFLTCAESFMGKIFSLCVYPVVAFAAQHSLWG